MIAGLIGVYAVFFYTGLHSLTKPVQFARMLGLAPDGRSGEIDRRESLEAVGPLAFAARRFEQDALRILDADNK